MYPHCPIRNQSGYIYYDIFVLSEFLRRFPEPHFENHWHSCVNHADLGENLLWEFLLVLHKEMKTFGSMGKFYEASRQVLQTHLLYLPSTFTDRKCSSSLDNTPTLEEPFWIPENHFCLASAPFILYYWWPLLKSSAMLKGHWPGIVSVKRRQSPKT